MLFECSRKSLISSILNKANSTQKETKPMALPLNIKSQNKKKVKIMRGLKEAIFLRRTRIKNHKNWREVRRTMENCMMMRLKRYLRTRVV